MSFGWSITDVANLVGLAWRTYQGARTACGAYAELTNETRNLHIILSQLGKEYEDPGSLINRLGDTYHEDIEGIVAGCKQILESLNRTLENYNALGEKQRSARKMFQSIDFGNKTMSLTNVRTQITSYTSEMTLYLNLISLGSMGRVETTMEKAGDDLKKLKSAVNSIAATLSMTEGSVLSSHTNDDRAVWKEFRGKLIRRGFKSSQLRKYEATIQSYLTELSDRGALDAPGDSFLLKTNGFPRGDPEERFGTDLQETGMPSSYNDRHAEQERESSISTQYCNSNSSSGKSTYVKTHTEDRQGTEMAETDEMEKVTTSEIST